MKKKYIKKCRNNKYKFQASEDVKIHNKHHRRERSVERSDTIRHNMKKQKITKKTIFNHFLSSFDS